jgi:hypothetical protein
MAPPVGRKDVTAADIGMAAPITKVELADDFGKPIAKDIRDVAAMALKNHAYLTADQNVEYTYTDVPIPGLLPLIAAPNNIMGAPGNTWTDMSIKVDVIDCKVGDDIKVRVWGSWQFNAASNATTVGRARVAFYLDPAGTPTLVPNVLGIATISDDGGSLTLPHTENFYMEFRYRVAAPIPTNPVTVRAVVQARSEDLTGGAGTATVFFLHSARMDVTHTKRS